MTKQELAAEKFQKGYNCCQSVACAFCATMCPDTAIRVFRTVRTAEGGKA